MKRKNAIILVAVVLLLMVGTVLLCVCFGKNREMENDLGSELDTVPSQADPEKAENSFVLTYEIDADGYLIVTLSLKKAMICAYHLSVEYDADELQLVDYDDEIGIYAPIVINPMKEDVTSANGKISFEWASARNITKPGDIICLKFALSKEDIEGTMVKLNCESVKKLDDTVVVDASFAAESLTVKLK